MNNEKEGEEDDEGLEVENLGALVIGMVGGEEMTKFGKHRVIIVSGEERNKK